jgi:hypothetical protein
MRDFAHSGEDVCGTCRGIALISAIARCLSPEKAANNLRLARSHIRRRIANNLAGEGRTMMKTIKMLSVTMLAALMGMAFVGAGSAMAESTAFCAVDPGTGPEEVCPKGNLITKLHAATAEVLPAAVLTTLVDVVCDVLYSGKTTSELASPLILNGTFVYENCESSAGGECTVTETSAESKITLLKTGHDKAEAKLESEFLVSCNTIHCRYSTGGMKGLFKGALLPFKGEEEEFGDATLKKVSGFLCPTAAELDLLVFSLETFTITK